MPHVTARRRKVGLHVGSARRCERTVTVYVQYIVSYENNEIYTHRQHAAAYMEYKQCQRTCRQR